MKTYKEFLEEVTRYNVDGEVLTKGGMLKKAVAKEIDFEGKKPKFLAVISKDGGNRKVFPITKKEYQKLSVKDITPENTKKEFLRWLHSNTKQSMQDKIDWNVWVKKENPSIDVQIEKLLQK